MIQLQENQQTILIIKHGKRNSIKLITIYYLKIECKLCKPTEFPNDQLCIESRLNLNPIFY